MACPSHVLYCVLPYLPTILVQNAFGMLLEQGGQQMALLAGSYGLRNHVQTACLVPAHTELTMT